MSQITKEYLAPSSKLVDAVVGWIIKNQNAYSKGSDPIEYAFKCANRFDHLMVVVPTAESGRNLRLALAKAFPDTGVLPPRVIQPSHLLTPAEEITYSVGSDPTEYVISDKTLRQASEVELQAAFLAFLASKKSEIKDRGIWPLLFKPGFLDDARALLGFLDQLNEIWHALAGRALLMCDVLQNSEAVKVLTGAVGCEMKRWEQLGDFETQFFAFLETKGVCHYAKKVQLAVANPAPPPAEIKEVILPALVDPIQAMYPVLEKWQEMRPNLKITVLIHADESAAGKFDAWGRPIPTKWGEEKLTKLRTEDIFRSATNQALGEKVAAEFCKIAQGQPLPALGLIDAGTFSDVQAALMTREKNVHNPERHALNVSSLGAIVDLVMSVWEKSSDRITLEWKEIAGLVRQHDVMMYLAPAGGTLNRADILAELDTFANKFLPVGCPTAAQLAYSDKHTKFENLSAAIDKLKSLFEVQKNLSDFISHALQKLYAHATSNREFQAAAAAVRRFLNDLKSEEFQSLPSKEQLLIARPALARTNYQLEPEGESVIKTLGWLELAWTAKEQIALVGFHEGCVPDALIGHAFLPNKLRTALGLTSNDQRLARDVYLLKELLACREGNDVKFFVALANAAGDIQKPSRLLFLCEEEELPVRACHLFDEIQETSSPPEAPKKPWTYKWPTEIPLPNARKGFRGSLSPSAIDTYLNCPFTYFLKYGLGMNTVKMNEEIPANDFGTLAHKILEDYGKRHLNSRIGETEEQIRAELMMLCDEEFKRVYGKQENWTINTLLQLESLKKRIQAFAKQQYMWAQEKWQIYACEYKLNKNGEADEELYPFKNHPDVALRGSVDRIDHHPLYGYRLIDYKTWDTKDYSHVFSAKKEDLHFAKDVMGLSLYETVTRTKKGEERIKSYAIKSIQLPLYARALETKKPDQFKPDGQSQIYDMCYIVLGDSPEEVGAIMDQKDEKFQLNKIRPLADQIVDKLLEEILANKFWPASPNALKWEFGEYFFANIEKSIDPEWIQKVTR